MNKSDVYCIRCTVKNCYYISTKTLHNNLPHYTTISIDELSYFSLTLTFLQQQISRITCFLQTVLSYNFLIVSVVMVIMVRNALMCNYYSLYALHIFMLRRRSNCIMEEPKCLKQYVDCDLFDLRSFTI